MNPRIISHIDGRDTLRTLLKRKIWENIVMGDKSINLLNHLDHQNIPLAGSRTGPSFLLSGQEGQISYSHLVGNLIEAIKNLKKRKASLQVFATFSGLPMKRDPTHIKLRETGWIMALRVFPPLDV